MWNGKGKRFADDFSSFARDVGTIKAEAIGFEVRGLLRSCNLGLNHDILTLLLVTDFLINLLQLLSYLYSDSESFSNFSSVRYCL